jgi:NitT/TauT family transport system substrate-binding protein
VKRRFLNFPYSFLSPMGGEDKGEGAVFVLPIILTLALLVTSPLHAQSLKRIRIGSTTPSITTLPSEIAAKRGFFKDEGLDPEMITIRSADIIIKALLTGQLDYSTALPSLVTAAVRGLPIKVVGVMIKKTSYVMVSHPSARSIQDLKGKVIGTSSFGAASDYAIRIALQKGGLDPKKDVTIIQVGGSAGRLAALQGGTIQATVLVAPFNLQAEKLGYRSLLWLGKIMDFPQGGLGAHDKKLQENPQEVVRVMKAIARGIQLVKSEREETVKFMMSWLSLDRSVAEGVYPIVSESLADYGIVEDSVLESAVDAARFQGVAAEREIPASQLRDWSFAQKARDEILQKKPQR